MPQGTQKMVTGESAQKSGRPSVHPLSPPYQVMVGGFGGMVGGQGPGLGLVLLLGLSEIAPPGRVASGKTEFLLL